MQSGAAAYCITGGAILPDSKRLRETLREKIKPENAETTRELLQLRADRLSEMRDRVTPEMIHELDEALAKRASTLKPFKKKGRTGWRNEFIRALHATRAGPSLRRMAIHFLLGKAPLHVYRKYGHVALGPRDKGSGAEDPRPVGAPDPFWRWSVRSGVQVFEKLLRRKLAPHQYAIGVSNGAEKMGKAMSFDAAQLPGHAIGSPDVKNAYNELKRKEAVNDLCKLHPLAGTMGLALYTVVTVYVHDTRGMQPVKYPTADGVIQGCGMAMDTFCNSQDESVDWITQTLQAAGRGQVCVPDFKADPPDDLKDFIREWLKENHISEPTAETSVVVHRHYADNGAYGVVPKLMGKLPALAAKCLEVKGLQYKKSWEVWSPTEFSLDDGENFSFDVKKPNEGLVLAGGECGPIDMPIIVGNDSYVRAKLLKRARRIEGYLGTLASVVDNAARAYHAERLAFRVLKQTARPRAQSFLRAYAPEITEEAGCIVDEAVKKAEVKLLGWSDEEANQALAQASLGFEHGGHDMQEKTSDRYLLHLAAWLDAMEELNFDCSAEESKAQHHPPKIERITRETVLGHPLLAPRLAEIYDKARARNPTLPAKFKRFVTNGLGVCSSVSWIS